MTENRWKQQEKSWKWYIRKSSLTEKEKDVLWLFDDLCDATNCVHVKISELGYLLSQFGSRSERERILFSLMDKNIIIPNDADGQYFNQALTLACAHCRLEHGSKECRARHGRYYINKNPQTWKINKLPRINKYHINNNLENNGFDPLRESLNASIKRSMDNLKNS